MPRAVRRSLHHYALTIKAPEPSIEAVLFHHVFLFLEGVSINFTFQQFDNEANEMANG